MQAIRRIFIWGLGALLLATLLAAVPAGAGAYLVGKRPIAGPKGAHDMCTRYAWACSTARGDLGDDQMRVVRNVNATINARVRQVSDRRQYRRDEVWALPTRRGGDCEDFALLKKRELMRRGIPADRLLIATVLDRNLGGHAVLVVRTHRGDMVLDNLTSRVLHWQKTGYTFLRMQDPNRPGGWEAILAGGTLARHNRG